MVHGGKIWKWGKNTIFLSPINFLQVFLSQVGKNWTRGENIILFLLKFISKKLSSKKGKINTIQHGQGEKHRQRIFSPSTTPAIVEQLIAWPRREKMKTQGEKIKTQGEKIKTEGEKLRQGEKYHTFSPSYIFVLF